MQIMVRYCKKPHGPNSSKSYADCRGYLKEGHTTSDACIRIDTTFSNKENDRKDKNANNVKSK